MSNNDKSKSLREEYERIINENKDLDIAKFVVKQEDLSQTPFGQKIEIYDYELDIRECSEKAKDVVKSLANMYLGDYPSLLNSEYVQKKIQEDSDVYAEILFAKKMTIRLLIQQLKQIDSLNNGSRNVEVTKDVIKEVRDNSVFASTQKTELEKFYKEIRKDFGLEVELKTDMNSEDESTDKKDEGGILDPRYINDVVNKLKKDK